MRLTIKNKLYALAASVVLALLVLFLINNGISNSQDTLNRIALDNAKLQVDMLMLRRNEKDFLMRQDLKYLDKFSKNVQKANSDLSLMLTDIRQTDLSDSEAKQLGLFLKSYHEKFESLVKATEEKGLDKDSGHYGKLRRATHDLESHLNASNNDKALVLLLTLRRHEKDFILRSDPKYVDRLKTTANKLSSLLSADSQATSLIDKYVYEFGAFYDITKRIGLNEKEGIRGDMRQAVHKLETSLKNLSSYYQSEIASSLAQSKWLQVMVSLVISAAIVAGLILISRQVVLPIEHLSKSFEDIRKSDDLTKRIETLRDDEIGAVSKDFNILVDYFHKMVEKIYESVTKLESATGIVSQSVHNTQNSISQQALQSDMVATAVTEMGAAANDIAKNAETTAGTVNSVHESAQLGAKKVQATIGCVGNLANSLVSAGDNMTQLKEKSDGITSVLDVIKGIAEQTNLLALNAAIEAARAGEQGRGFAVVADEVRGLAARTSSSTTEIADVVKKNVELSQLATNTMQSSIEQVSQGTDLVEKLSASIEDINAGIDKIVQTMDNLNKQ